MDSLFEGGTFTVKGFRWAGCGGPESLMQQHYIMYILIKQSKHMIKIQDKAPGFSSLKQEMWAPFQNGLFCFFWSLEVVILIFLKCPSGSRALCKTHQVQISYCATGHSQRFLLFLNLFILYHYSTFAFFLFPFGSNFKLNYILNLPSWNISVYWLDVYHCDGREMFLSDIFQIRQDFSFCLFWFFSIYTDT